MPATAEEQAAQERAAADREQRRVEAHENRKAAGEKSAATRKANEEEQSARDALQRVQNGGFHNAEQPLGASSRYVDTAQSFCGFFAVRNGGNL